MTRIKRGTVASKRRKKVLKMVKGFRWRRKSNYRAAKEALLKAGKYAYRDRRAKKRTRRALWITRINTACREAGLTYKDFVNKIKKEGIELNRKILSELIAEYPKVFTKILEEIKK